MDWMFLPLKRYADFQGRSRRMEYWMFTLGIVIVYILFFLIAGGTGMFRDRSYGAPPPASFMILFAVLAVFMLAIIVPAIAVQVRRFHDQDRSGWMVLLGFIPYVGGLIVLVFMCLPGTTGPNRFGPDPLDPNGTNTLTDVFR